VYLNRRNLLQLALAAGVLGPQLASAAPTSLQSKRNAQFSTTEAPNTFEEITTYNNFYEFGTSKSDPAENSGSFKPQPWKVTIAGEAEITGTYVLDDLLKAHALEERVYRLRCVEAWSMVIPWIGVPLAALLKRFKPTSKAKYVAFKTVMRPNEMPGQRYDVLEWPYVEGLRIDEATAGLTKLSDTKIGGTLENIKFVTK